MLDEFLLTCDLFVKGDFFNGSCHGNAHHHFITIESGNVFFSKDGRLKDVESVVFTDPTFQAQTSSR